MLLLWPTTFVNKQQKIEYARNASVLQTIRKSVGSFLYGPTGVKWSFDRCILHNAICEGRISSKNETLCFNYDRWLFSKLSPFFIEVSWNIWLEWEELHKLNKWMSATLVSLCGPNRSFFPQSLVTTFSNGVLAPFSSFHAFIGITFTDTASSF